MSRTPGASCLIDVRTTAVCQDYVITSDPCVPGAAEAIARRKLLSGCSYLLDNCEPPACGYDRKKDFVSTFGAFLIIATCLGIMHTFSIFVPLAAVAYGAGFLELCLVSALSYLVAILTACISIFIIELAGHKLTAICGMTLVFLGVLLDSQAFHISVLYVSNILLIGVGTGLAYSASVTLPSDLFRTKILVAVIIVDIAGSLGTVFFTWLCTELIDVLGFTWTRLTLAVLALFFTLGVHVFPKTRLLYARNCKPGGGRPIDKATAIRECVIKAAADSKPKPNTCEEDANKNWLCVCVCDMSLYKDKSFVLWAVLVMIATMNFHLAYLYVNSYAETQRADLSPWYVTVYCLGSIVLRCIFIKNLDYTFRTNRVLFIACLAGSGVMWIVICFAQTFGWIIVCCFVLGAIEGIFCVIIGRLTLGTIPRRWIVGAWVTCLLFHAFGMFIMTVFTAAIAQKTLHYYVPFTTTGIIQIIAAFLAILLPNEEGEGCGDAVATTTTTTMSTYKRCTFDYIGSSYSPKVPEDASKKVINYKCQCPICSKIGCLDPCLPQTCTPKGSLDC